MKLHNRYFGMRHGISIANMQGLVISDIKNGRHEYGLTKDGEVGVRTAVEASLHSGILTSETIIISSDFKRAFGTAEIARDILHTSDIIIAEELRERHFGLLEKSTNAVSEYSKIWAQDPTDPDHKTHQVESTNEVSSRVADLIDRLEKDYTDRTILLVSHGDTLQILQAYFQGQSSGLHRSFSPFQNAEIRELTK